MKYSPPQTGDSSRIPRSQEIRENVPPPPRPQSPKTSLPVSVSPDPKPDSQTPPHPQTNAQQEIRPSGIETNPPPSTSDTTPEASREPATTRGNDLPDQRIDPVSPPSRVPTHPSKPQQPSSPLRSAEPRRSPPPPYDPQVQATHDDP